MRRPWYKRLNVQLIAMLTLALLPIGSIALFQTNRVAVEADRTAGLSLLGMTERAARGEQFLIERAVGAARLFGSVAPDLLDDPQACFTNLSRYVAANPEYSFIGILPQSGIVACSSVQQPVDFRSYPGFADSMQSREPSIVVTTVDPTSAHSDFVISEPFEVNGAFAGFVSIYIPHAKVPETSARMEELGLKELITFNDEGGILTSRSTLEEATNELPAGSLLAGLSTDEPQTFRATNRNGVERRYSIVTIEGSPAAVMAVWSVTDDATSRFERVVGPAVFPVLMWLASMGVAMLAMNTLVLRHLRRISRKMDAFANTRQIDDSMADKISAPIEIEHLEQNFAQMGEEILRDEANLENALREKGVLVKEIHHRVKNNLQLISSIINMKVRVAKHDETKTILRRIQERVLSLATIHRDLYQSQDGGRVDAGNLIQEIVEKSAELVPIEGRKLDVSMDINTVMLYPDQAVPLSLLVAEAMTNAIKYIGGRPSKDSFISVSLHQDDRDCFLKMSNSIGASEDQDSTGLGSKLMKAFSTQLGGKIDVEQTEDRFTLTLRFTALDFQPEALDY